MPDAAATSSPTSRRTARCADRTSSCCARSSRAPRSLWSLPEVSRTSMTSLRFASSSTSASRVQSWARLSMPVHSRWLRRWMSQETDDSCEHGAHNDGDSAGVPWKGRSFEANPHSGDDGSADPALLAALVRFRAGEGSQSEVIDAFRSARVLIPLIAEKGDEGVAPNGLAVDKTQELSIVTVASPDGRKVQPVLSSVTAMQKLDPSARPIPVDAVRAALAASAEDTYLIVLDPTSETEFVIRRPAVWAIAQRQ